MLPSVGSRRGTRKNPLDIILCLDVIVVFFHYLFQVSTCCLIYLLTFNLNDLLQHFSYMRNIFSEPVDWCGAVLSSGCFFQVGKISFCMTCWISVAPFIATPAEKHIQLWLVRDTSGAFTSAAGILQEE